jgi:hypothetical protein
MTTVLKRYSWGIFTLSQGGLFGSHPQMVLGTVKQDAGPHERWPKALKTKLTRGDHLVWVHSDQMVLVMVRWEAGPHEKQPNMLKGELENNSRKPRGLVRKLAW